MFLLVLLGGVAGFGVLWYVDGGEDAALAPRFGGSYVEGLAGAPSRVNPLFARRNAADETLVSLVFAGLTRLDAQGQAFPDLAETWSVSPDGRSFSFRLRAGLVWQDGHELTAEDVAFTYRLVRALGLRADPLVVAALEDAVVTAVDRQNVTFELRRPFAALPAYLTLGIVPAHLLAVQDAESVENAAFNQRPVGAGPYRLEALTRERAVLSANAAYHFGRPYVSEIELRFFRDEGAVMAALKGGGLDGALLAFGAGRNDRLALETRSGLRLQDLSAGSVTSVYLNLRAPVFQDRRLRQALFHAIDRQRLVSDVLAGNAVVAESFFAPGGWAFAPSLRRYDANAGVAALLLDEAGWPAGPDGVRRRDGRELSVRLSTDRGPLHAAVAEAVAAAWREVGVRVEVLARGATELVRDVIEPRAFDALLFSVPAGADPDPFRAWHSGQAAGLGGNLSGFKDERVDRLIEEARGAAPPLRRKELYAELQARLAEELPALPLYAPTALYAQRQDLHGVDLRRLAEPGGRFWQVRDWFIAAR